MDCKNWFNENIDLQPIFPYPNNYKKINIADFDKYTNFENILTDISINNTQLSDLNYIIKDDNNENENENDNNNNYIMRCYKYEIIFNPNQKLILNKFYEECEIIYNLCVDIWNNNKSLHKYITNWIILKDIVYKYYYRLPLKKYGIDARPYMYYELKKVAKHREHLYTLKLKEIIKIKNNNNEIYNKNMKEYLKNLNIYKQSKQNEVMKPIKPKKQSIDNEIKKINDKYKKLMKDCDKKQHNEKLIKNAPDETIKAEIKYFCSNLKSSITQHGINGFEIGYKNTEHKKTLTLSNKSISKKGISINTMGELNCRKFKNIINKHKINHECKLKYENCSKKYYLFIPETEKKMEIDQNKKEIVALDPGEKIFQTYYSRNEIGKIGENMREKILHEKSKIDKLKSIGTQSKNKNGNRLNKKSITKKIKKINNKIKGYVNEIHKKATKYLCENYKVILIPEFKTKNMLSKKEVEKYELKLNEKLSKSEKTKIMNKLELHKNVKKVIQSQSHYKFRTYLAKASERYRTKVIIVDEKYTSKICTYCGIYSDKYTKNREKICKCKNKIDRDVNGSRNIMLKNAKKIIKIAK